MAEGDKQSAKDLVLANCEPKSYNKKDGTKGEFFILTFVGGLVAKTFSKSCAEAVKPLVGKPLDVDVEETKPFQGKPEYKPIKVTFEGKVVYDAAEDKSQRRGGGGGGNSRPDWSYETYEERQETCRSIERQVSLKAAVELGSHYTPAPASAAIISMAEEFAKFIYSAESSAPGSRPGRKTKADTSPGPSRTVPASTAAAPDLPSPGNDVPPPGAEPSAATLGFDEMADEDKQEAAMLAKTLTEKYGTKWKIRFTKLYGRPAVEGTWSPAELERLLDELDEE